MANEFHQHPDGLIYVRTATGTYVDTPENFGEDFGRPIPPLPAGADEHVYTQGRRHCFMGGGDVIDGGPMQWPVGDEIIASIAAGLSAQSGRKAKTDDTGADMPS